MTTRQSHPLEDENYQTVENKASCVAKGHNYNWVELEGRIYRTCGQCGNFKLMIHVKDKDSDS